MTALYKTDDGYAYLAHAREDEIIELKMRVSALESINKHYAVLLEKHGIPALYKAEYNGIYRGLEEFKKVRARRMKKARGFGKGIYPKQQSC
jgi:hypothetical protein